MLEDHAVVVTDVTREKLAAVSSISTVRSEYLNGMCQSLRTHLRTRRSRFCSQPANGSTPDTAGHERVVCRCREPLLIGWNSRKQPTIS